MSQPAQSAPQAPNPAAPSPAQAIRKLKRGELLFREGEMSKSMYLVRSGVIRIFKKKGEQDIEIDTVRSGMIIGELAFLDGQPRSASAEAMTDCELMEISSSLFAAVVGKMPDWLKILLKAVVGRLRQTTVRLKNLENASTQMDYSGDASKRHFVFLATHDVLKIGTAILLVAARHSSTSEKGIALRMSALERYGNQILGVPVAKITSLVDLLTQAGVMEQSPEGIDIYLKDIDFLEQFIGYLNDENLLEPSKRHDLTLKGFLIMGLINRHLSKYDKDPASGVSIINIAEIRLVETKEGGREPFQMDEFQELVNLGYCTALAIKSGTEATTTVKAESFAKAFRMQRLVKMFDALNEQKRGK